VLRKYRNGATTVREWLHLALTALCVRGSGLGEEWPIFIFGGERSAGHGEIGAGKREKPGNGAATARERWISALSEQPRMKKAFLYPASFVFFPLIKDGIFPNCRGATGRPQ
jgi:hypothetical protein